VYYISHQTVYSAPSGASNDRTEIGVKEKVDLAVRLDSSSSPVSATWTANGFLLAQNATNVRIHAPMAAATVEVTAAVGNESSTLVFSVIEPSALNADVTPSAGYADNPGDCFAQLSAKLTLAPSHVSFGGGVWLGEIHKSGNVTDKYGNPHTIGSPYPSTPVGEDNSLPIPDTARTIVNGPVSLSDEFDCTWQWHAGGAIQDIRKTTHSLECTPSGSTASIVTTGKWETSTTNSGISD
jgi:hypothetical protein